MIRIPGKGIGLIGLIGMLLAGCGTHPLTNDQFSPCNHQDPWLSEGNPPPWAGIQGALLASRIDNLDSLRKVILIEYYPPPGKGIEVSPEDSLVRLTHCSGGKQIISVLSGGMDQGDLSRAQRGTLEDKIEVGLGTPYAVANRMYLQRIEILARWRPEYFGEGDPAFFDLASHMVNHINTPDKAYAFPRDSSEKGYLNTFNHIVGQAFVTSLYSEELADFVADVHERAAMPELVSGSFRPEQLTDPNTNAIDNYVDIVNNEWGQELGKALREKYDIASDTPWSRELLKDYLNDIQQYCAWGLNIGFQPFRVEDTVVVRFTGKLNFVQSYFPE